MITSATPCCRFLPLIAAPCNRANSSTGNAGFQQLCCEHAASTGDTIAHCIFCRRELLLDTLRHLKDRHRGLLANGKSWQQSAARTAEQAITDLTHRILTKRRQNSAVNVLIILVIAALTIVFLGRQDYVQVSPVSLLAISAQDISVETCDHKSTYAIRFPVYCIQWVNLEFCQACGPCAGLFGS